MSQALICGRLFTALTFSDNTSYVATQIILMYQQSLGILYSVITTGQTWTVQVVS